MIHQVTELIRKIPSDLEGFTVSTFVRQQRWDKVEKENQTVQLGGRFRPAAALTIDTNSVGSLSSVMFSSYTSKPCEPWEIKS